MRTAVSLRALILVSAIAVLGVLSNSAWAGTKKLPGTWQVGIVFTDCINAGGTATAGTGEGGFGCKTSKGEVSCTKDGQCTGTCGNCSARTIRHVGLQGVLQGGRVTAKSSGM